MKEKERDTIDDLFRSKLQDFEVDTVPGDWEAISGRLPGKAPVPFRKVLRYWAAAAVISLLMITGGVYMFNQEEKQMPIADTIRQKTQAVESQLAEKAASSDALVEQVKPASVAPATPVVAMLKHSDAKIKKVAIPVLKEDDTEKIDDTEIATLSSTNQERRTVVAEEAEVQATDAEKEMPERAELHVESRSLLAEVAPVVEKEKKVPARKWGFGMGGGSVSTGSNNSVGTLSLRNYTSVIDEDLMLMNALHTGKGQLPKTNIKHKTPISVGFSVSRYLNDRFSLQSGLNYTFLSSKWETLSDPSRKTKQKLHFIGIPLSLSYKIAEWERIQFYAAAGGMTEVNVAGKVDSKLYTEKGIVGKEHESIRMKEWSWSVNARVGASYPLLRFLSVYAEAGVGYYFDNGSNIETIRSEKPFNVNLQAGFRLGF